MHCCYGVVILLLLGSCYFWDVDMTLKFWAATAHDEIKTGCEVGGEDKESWEESSQLHVHKMKIWKRLKMMMNSPRICYRNIPPWYFYNHPWQIPFLEPFFHNLHERIFVSNFWQNSASFLFDFCELREFLIGTAGCLHFSPAHWEVESSWHKEKN